MLDDVWYPISVLLVVYAVVINNFGLSIPFRELESEKKLVKNATQTDWGLDSIKRWNWRKHKSSLEDKNLNKNYHKPYYKLSLRMPWGIWNKQKHTKHHSDVNHGKTIIHRTQQLQKQLNGPSAFRESEFLQNPAEFVRRKYNKITTRGYYYRWSREKASRYDYERSLSIYEDVNDTIDFEYDVKSYEQWFNYPLTTPSCPNPGWHLPTIQKYYKRAKREARQVIFWSKQRKQIEKQRLRKRFRKWRKKARELKARGKFRTKKKGDGSYRGGRGKRPRSHTKRPVLNYTVTPNPKWKKEDKKKEDTKDNATNKTVYDEEYEEVEEEVTYEEYDDSDDDDDDVDESNDMSKTVKRT